MSKDIEVHRASTGGTTPASSGPDNFSYHTILVGETVTIPTRQEMWVYQSITIDGTLDLVGTGRLILKE